MQKWVLCFILCIANLIVENLSDNLIIGFLFVFHNNKLVLFSLLVVVVSSRMISVLLGVLEC